MNDTTDRTEQECLTVSCPTCGVHGGQQCQTPSGKTAKKAHQARFDFASACNRISVA